MAKIEGEPTKPPASIFTSKLALWLTRTIQWLNAKGLIEDLPPPAAKCIKASEEVLTKMTTRPPSNPTLEEDFQHNYAFVLHIDSKDLDKLSTRQGRLVVNLDERNPDQAKQLIKQTIRQARGRLIDAQHGYLVNEKALHDLDKLNEHVRKSLPECIEKDPGSPVRILSGTYQTERPLTREELTHSNTILQKVLRTRRDINAKIGKLVRRERCLADIPTPGLNPAKIVTVSGEHVAIEKASTEKQMGMITAACLGKDPKTEWEKFAPMAGVNELIASNLNVFLGGKFGIPLATRQGEETAHAFADNIGSLYAACKDNQTIAKAQTPDEIKAAKETFLKSLPISSCQGFILGQLTLGGLDCHANNVLLDSQKNPIAIDFGRSLGTDPLHAWCNLRACYLDWPAMDAELSKEDLKFLKTLNIEELVSQLRTTIETQYADLLKDFDFKIAMIGTFIHLEARLVTLQEAACEGMTTLRQITTLFLPPIFESYEKEFLSVREGSRYTWAAQYISSQGFKHAFKNAIPQQQEGFQERFRELIRKEISLWKNFSKKVLYGSSTNQVYRLAGIDISEF